MSEEDNNEFLQNFINDKQIGAEPTWRERQLARKEERLRTRQEAAEKAKLTREGRNTGTQTRKKDGKSNPEYMKEYRQKQKDEGLMGKTAPDSEWANLPRGYQISPDQMGMNHPLNDNTDIPPGEDDLRYD